MRLRKFVDKSRNYYFTFEREKPVSGGAPGETKWSTLLYGGTFDSEAAMEAVLTTVLEWLPNEELIDKAQSDGTTRYVFKNDPNGTMARSTPCPTPAECGAARRDFDELRTGIDVQTIEVVDQIPVAIPVDD